MVDDNSTPTAVSTPREGLPATRPGSRLLRAGILSLFAVESLVYLVIHVTEDHRDLITHWLVVFALSSVVIGFSRLRAGLQFIGARFTSVPVSWGLLFFHICTSAFLVTIVSAAATRRFAETSSLLTAVWLCAGIAAVGSASMTLVSPHIWRDAFRGTGKLWIYSAAATWIGIAIEPVLWRGWTNSYLTYGVDLTFWLVSKVLRPFVSMTSVDWPNHMIGTDRFVVEITGACSGWEGLGLVTIFTAISLWLSRREYRFPNALLLIPMGMALVFALNVVRIAALILIGHHGWPGVAIRGFHSQAGWIAFSCVALGISVVGPRIRWLGTPREPITRERSLNQAVPFLLPFAVILAAGMISLATADGFEWLYPLRFFAAIAALWFCRRQYSALFRDWKPGWFPILSGALVFTVWISLDQSSASDGGIATGLAKLSPSARIFWLSVRVLAAITTVPLAEELAFRGFLFRRMISAEFEAVDARRWTYLALAGSSLLFGLLHGDRWIAGTFAGLVYSAAMIRRGRIADAVAAHAVTNAILAAWVLHSKNWFYW